MTTHTRTHAHAHAQTHRHTHTPLHAGGRYRTQALAVLASFGGSDTAAASAGAAEEEALAAAMASLSLAAKEDTTTKTTTATTTGKPAAKKASAGGGAAAAAHRTLLERLPDLDGGDADGSGGFALAHLPPAAPAVRAKPQLFDIAFNYLDGRLPDLGAKAGLPPRKGKQGQQGQGGGGGGGGARGGGEDGMGWEEQSGLSCWLMEEEGGREGRIESARPWQQAARERGEGRGNRLKKKQQCV